MSIKTIFVDRDGVINKEVNYLHKVKDFNFIDGVFKSLKYLNNLGYEIIIVTNQSGIGRGYFSENEYNELTSWMINQFEKNNIKILNIFHCPHDPKANCECRKPKPGMFFDAKKKYKIDTAKSWMIGDSERDITAANMAGIKNTVLVKSGHNIDENHSEATYFLDSIKDINQIIY